MRNLGCRNILAHPPRTKSGIGSNDPEKKSCPRRAAKSFYCRSRDGQGVIVGEQVALDTAIEGRSTFERACLPLIDVQWRDGTLADIHRLFADGIFGNVD